MFRYRVTVGPLPVPTGAMQVARVGLSPREGRLEWFTVFNMPPSSPAGRESQGGPLRFSANVAKCPSRYQLPSGHGRQHALTPFRMLREVLEVHPTVFCRLYGVFVSFVGGSKRRQMRLAQRLDGCESGSRDRTVQPVGVKPSCAAPPVDRAAPQETPAGLPIA